jgi:hypothetical protein
VHTDVPDTEPAKVDIGVKEEEIAAIMPYHPVWRYALRAVDPMMLLMDSGAFAHVCPASFMPGLPLRKIPKPSYVANAIGKQLIFYGMRTVDFQTWKGLQLTIDFCVMSVNRPILSAGQLARDGYKVTLNGTSNLKIGHQLAPLVRRGSLFFLPVTRIGEPFSSLQTAALMSEIKATHTEDHDRHRQRTS